MIFLIIYLIILACLHSLWEIQIEGKKGGWAKKLPCWRKNIFLCQLLLNKELTGYHFYMFIIFLLGFHSPYFFIAFSIKKEILLLGLFIYYWLLEDFLWFCFNKQYGLKKFKPGKIKWHQRWFLNILPLSYAWSILIGGILLCIGMLI